MKNPIEAAVLPLKAEAIERAEKDARDLVARRYKALDEAGWNLDIVAPYPNTLRCSRKEYVEATRRRDAFRSITKTANPDTRGPHAPFIVEADADKASRFVELCKENAGASYEAFVAKLVAKIGDCDSAEIAGSHVWGHSILTVTKGETVERWKTKQIVNCSVHGLLFNQWPSRKVK